MAKIKIAEYREVPEGDMRKFDAKGVPIAVYKLSGQIYATSDICTYDGCFLDENHRMHNYMVECTLHNEQWDIRTGEVVIPPASEKLKVYKTEVIDDDIYVDVV
ncbi:MAG: Ferredoxin [Candidatus Curtissbacteria bacterium GW2011_GWA1_40_16]|uniref:Ferredoxin n=1 Tax=Candidatus Curtissbacteria bacterium GW2011_GWA1_40_16 TaxID=1618405 RepID=A0A0G0ULF0_9BACT|nr:MAG: Ferredoxin [Candidatus Curtissbacteria bacterium GW2011_GWA1_40_16]